MSLVVHGQVQGVGYRASVTRFIDDNYLEIKGFVRNLPNGTVKIVAQGAKEELGQLRQFASEGSRLSKPEQIEESTWAIVDYTYHSFEISY